MTMSQSDALLAGEAKQTGVSVANLLASRLQDAILDGRFPVGGSLPTERDLMDQYQVSRATVREGLRILSTLDLIEVRRGRSGGSFVASPNANALVRSLNQLIGGHAFRLIDLVAAREAIEPAAAAQAAMSGTEDRLEALRLASVECELALGEGERFVEANLKWHLALAEASGNPLFVAFLTSISTAMHTATSFEEFDLRIRKAVIGVHWQIYDAIRQRDPEAARRRTLRHLGAYSEELAAINSRAD